ncbi:MAG: formylglycine-generating enzyme family protein [Verrucomicrobia bacterium]|nr:formylglycine-generating enzyme family protein [Verrucomicrobiota bacterium]
MNRVSLSAFAAALLLSSPAAILAQEKTMTTSTGMELVWIPPGDFMMGSTAEERTWALSQGGSSSYVNCEGKQPRKVVVKQGFSLGKTEVTVGQWKRFAEAAGFLTEGEKNGQSHVPKTSERGWGDVKGANWKDPNFGFKQKDHHPACCISWNDAVAFCAWLTATEKNARKLPQGMVYRLPTEAEWEYACRAGSRTKFWWGDTMDKGEGRLNWSRKDDGFAFTGPVDHYGARGRNKFGLADMLGNVREWCLDKFDPAGAHAEYWVGDTPQRVLRGGSFIEHPGDSRCASRVNEYASRSHACYGFRVCCGVPR